MKSRTPRLRVCLFSALLIACEDRPREAHPEDAGAQTTKGGRRRPNSTEAASPLPLLPTPNVRRLVPMDGGVDWREKLLEAPLTERYTLESRELIRDLVRNRLPSLPSTLSERIVKCASGAYWACSVAAESLITGEEGVHLPPQGAALHRYACAKGDSSCRPLAYQRAYVRQPVEERNTGTPGTAPFAEPPPPTCHVLQESCTPESALLSPDALAGELLGEAIQAFRAACLSRDGQSCVLAGELFSRPESRDATSEVTALDFYVRGCDLGEALGCALAGRQMLDDPSRRVQAKGYLLIRNACSLSSNIFPECSEF